MADPRSALVILWVGLVTLLGAPAAAREPTGGVNAFVAEVLQRNPMLRAKTLTRDAARHEAQAAGSWPDPQAVLMLDRVPERMNGEMPMLRYQVTQMMMWPGKLGLMQAAAERRTSAAHADAKTLRLDLIRDAKRAYWMLLMNQGLREVNRAGRALLDTIASVALARYGAGSGAHHEVVRAQVEQGANDVEAIGLDGERMATIAMLNALRDSPADAAIEDPRDPEPDTVPYALPLRKLEQMAQARRPELERMQAMRREEVAMAALARRERYPDLMTSVWYNQMFGAPDTAGVMLGVPLPLFSLRRQNRLAQASDSRAGSAESELRAMQSMIRFEIADAGSKLVTATRTLDLVRNVAAPRANQNLTSSLAGYSTGTVDIVGVLEAWRSLQTIEQARVESIAARLMAIADLERAIASSWTEVSP